MDYPKLIVSADLNGTLVNPHTMSEMIRIYLGEGKYQEAMEYFRLQLKGQLSLRETFARAGKLTAGLTLYEAVEYVLRYMTYMDGFHEFCRRLGQNGIPLVINSTGYSATVYAMMHLMEKNFSQNPISGFIGNYLKFVNPLARDGKIYSEDKIKELVADCADNMRPLYSNIIATSEIISDLEDENDKAAKFLIWTQEHYPGIPSSHLVHIGDTFGDSGGIWKIAKAGGKGIAFNYNEELENFLIEKMSNEEIPGKIGFIDPKEDDTADLMHVWEYLCQEYHLA